MADMAKFLQKQFGEMKAQLDKVHRELIEVTAHERTTREVMATLKSDLTEVKSILHNMKNVPAQRTFPLRDMSAVETLCRKFADGKLVNDIKAEINYIFKNASKENFIQDFLSDEVTCLYKQADDIRKLNFMKHIINDITFTPKTNFTNMVNLAKARIYSARNRQNKKLEESAAVPPVVPALLAKPVQRTTPAKLTKPATPAKLTKPATPAKLTKPAPSAKLAPPAKRARQETVEEEECDEEIEEEEEPEEYDDEIEGDDGELESPEFSPVKGAQ
ncbi:uncharacterized protein LOC120432287 [Culex pipiens pallens]|uniref:uncharacterized protein LOC120426641 n=1 Tax=Culex pipiens pallens TaxID=42434 RepID=UPI001953E1A4|nr:uncharacterized protein LOC120426641 [Culex pipiens pallens]XP_039453408.1 uncharacterized protein LOC120432287 [Culex pipiens pallens]